MNSPQSNPSLYNAIEQVMTSILGTIHTALPGVIDKYDYAKSRAEVKPMLSRKYGDGTVVEMPIIPNVPVVWPRTSAGCMSFPLQRGDFVLLVFSERSIDEWLHKGETLVPGDPRRFNLADAVALPGFFPFVNSTLIPNNEDFQVIFNGNTIKIKNDDTIEIKGKNTVTIKPDGNIEVGASSLKALLTEDLLTFLPNHTHAGVQTGGGVSGIATFVPPITNVKTVKVKAQ
jgi:hypothetical protein